MITKAEIISQPSSGEFNERIYDNESPWNSTIWTWIKFTNDDYSEWCGQFRGSPRGFAVSAIHNTTLVLTSDYLFLLDRANGNIIEFEDRPLYHNLIVSPIGDYILADYYNLKKITHNLKNTIRIDSPIEMDVIKFIDWEGEELIFTCDEFLNWSRHLTMSYNYLSDKIEIKK